MTKEEMSKACKELVKCGYKIKMCKTNEKVRHVVFLNFADAEILILETSS